MSRPLPSRKLRSVSLLRVSWPDSTVPSLTHRLRIICCSSSTVCPVSASLMSRYRSQRRARCRGRDSRALADRLDGDDAALLAVPVAGGGGLGARVAHCPGLG